jgi:hypothetical protein
MSTVVIDGKGRSADALATPAARVRLTGAALDLLARSCGRPSLAEDLRVDGPDAVATRLGSIGATDRSRQVPNADPEEALREALLLDDDGPTPAGHALMAIWHDASLSVDLHLLVKGRAGRLRARSRHRASGRWVVAVSTLDGDTFEVARVPVEDWWLELGRTVHVAPRLLGSGIDVASSEPLPAVIETPWELLLATSEAVARDRHHLVSELVQGDWGPTRTGACRDDLRAAAPDDVRTLHLALEEMCLGRMHGLVTGHGGDGTPGAGAIEWVLFGDGWRSVTPVQRDGWRLVRIERRSVADVSRDLAAHVVGVVA